VINEDWRKRAAVAIAANKAAPGAIRKAEVLDDGEIAYPDGEVTGSRCIIPLLLTTEDIRTTFVFLPCDTRSNVNIAAKAPLMKLDLLMYGAQFLINYGEGCALQGLPIYCRPMSLSTTPRRGAKGIYMNPIMRKVDGWADFTDDDGLMDLLEQRAKEAAGAKTAVPRATPTARKRKFDSDVPF
jgi:hypothetical protein